MRSSKSWARRRTDSSAPIWPSRAGSPTGEYDVGFEGVAALDASTYRNYAVIRGDDRLYAIPGELSQLDA